MALSDASPETRQAVADVLEWQEREGKLLGTLSIINRARAFGASVGAVLIAVRGLALDRDGNTVRLNDWNARVHVGDWDEHHLLKGRRGTRAHLEGPYWW